MKSTLNSLLPEALTEAELAKVQGGSASRSVLSQFVAQIANIPTGVLPDPLPYWKGISPAVAEGIQAALRNPAPSTPSTD